MKNLFELKSLELAIYDAGIDGGETTSSAIEALHNREKALGVFNPSIPGPRWQSPSQEDTLFLSHTFANGGLAERIATALLTPYGGPEGTRLQIMLKRPDGTETNLGGNCKQSIINTVNRILEKP